MKFKYLLPVAALLSAHWLCAAQSSAATWTQAANKLKGSLGATGAIAKDAPGNASGQVNALNIHLEQISERLDTLDLAFNEAMLDPALSGDARTGYLLKAGQDLQAISTEYATTKANIATNYASVLGGDFLISMSETINSHLTALITVQTRQATNFGIPPPLIDPCGGLS